MFATIRSHLLLAVGRRLPAHLEDGAAVGALQIELPRQPVLIAALDLRDTFVLDDAVSGENGVAHVDAPETFARHDLTLDRAPASASMRDDRRRARH